MKNEKYKCSECNNGSSPLCELCFSITSPSGEKHKPLYFVFKKEIALTNETDVSDRIICNVKNRLPIPAKWFFEYNERFE